MATNRPPRSYGTFDSDNEVHRRDESPVSYGAIVSNYEVIRQRHEGSMSKMKRLMKEGGSKGMNEVARHVANDTEHIVRDFGQSSREVITGAAYGIGRLVNSMILLVLGFIISGICKFFKLLPIVIRASERYTREAEQYDMERRLEDDENAIAGLKEVIESMETKMTKNHANEVELESRIVEAKKDRKEDAKTIAELKEVMEILETEKKEIQYNEVKLQNRIVEVAKAREEDAKQIAELRQKVENLHEVQIQKQKDLENVLTSENF